MVTPARLRELSPAIAAVCAQCAGVVPGGGRVKQCMMENFDHLSDGCKSALKQMRAQSTK